MMPDEKRVGMVTMVTQFYLEPWNCQFDMHRDSLGVLGKTSPPWPPWSPLHNQRSLFITRHRPVLECMGFSEYGRGRTLPAMPTTQPKPDARPSCVMSETWRHGGMHQKGTSRGGGDCGCHAAASFYLCEAVKREFPFHSVKTSHHDS